MGTVANAIFGPEHADYTQTNSVNTVSTGSA